MIGKKWFTLIEVMIVIVILSTWILWAYTVVDYSINFVNATKVKVLAINYAREWIEWVFNIRDTNWRRWSWAGLRDACWLKIDPFANSGTNDGCEDDTWFGSGSYILSETTGGQKHFLLSGSTTPLETIGGDGMVDDSDKAYLLCKDPSTGYIKNCAPGTEASTSETHTQGLFFREIQGGYLLDKDANASLICSEWDDNWDGNIADGECGDSRFKEKNFCSIVEYKWFANGKIKLCSVITNFKP